MTLASASRSISASAESSLSSVAASASRAKSNLFEVEAEGGEKWAAEDDDGESGGHSLPLLLPPKLLPPPLPLLPPPAKGPPIQPALSQGKCLATEASEQLPQLLTAPTRGLLGE